jgi:hypothetical protein
VVTSEDEQSRQSRRCIRRYDQACRLGCIYAYTYVCLRRYLRSSMMPTVSTRQTNGYTRTGNGAGPRLTRTGTITATGPAFPEELSRHKSQPRARPTTLRCSTLRPGRKLSSAAHHPGISIGLSSAYPPAWRQQSEPSTETQQANSVAPFLKHRLKPEQRHDKKTKEHQRR